MNEQAMKNDWFSKNGDKNELLVSNCEYLCKQIISLSKKTMFKFKFQISQFLMQRQLTEFLLRLTFEKEEQLPQTQHLASIINQDCPLTSSQILNHIYSTINSQQNYKLERNHKLSLYSEETNIQSPQKCNCKKSKCLKLYCQCFARGSFCQGCSCDCCQNTKQFGQVRAKAIDEMLIKASVPFGSKTSSIKGCNCRKTGCRKKYCECYNQGIPCNEYCKCCNCENCKPNPPDLIFIYFISFIAYYHFQIQSKQFKSNQSIIKQIKIALGNLKNICQRLAIIGQK